MTTPYPRLSQQWSLIRGAIHVCHGASLAGLARSGRFSTSPSLTRMLDRLSKHNPMKEGSNHACWHLHQCGQDARAIVEDPAYGFNPDEVALIITTYEAALLAAADGVPFSLETVSLGKFNREELELVSAIAWRHGGAIRTWWASYAAAIEALFGGRS